MKLLIATVVFIVLVLVFSLGAAALVMLALGIIHTGIEAIPALGFAPVWAAMFILSLFTTKVHIRA